MGKHLNSRQRLSKALLEELRTLTGDPRAICQWTLDWQYNNKHHVILEGYPAYYALKCPKEMRKNVVKDLMVRHRAGALRFVYLGEERQRKAREAAIAKGTYTHKPRKTRSDSGFPRRRQKTYHHPAQAPRTRNTLTTAETAEDVQEDECLKVCLKEAWRDGKQRWNLRMECPCNDCCLGDYRT